MTMNRTPEDPRPGLALEVLPAHFGICRMRPNSKLPRWLHRSSFFSISRSSEELSIVCEEELIPQDLRCERGWRAIKVLGPLDLSLIGVLDSLARPLTRADVSIFALSTFETDYLLVRDSKLRRAVAVLEKAGHSFDDKPGSAAAERQEKTADQRPATESKAAETMAAATPPPEHPKANRVVKALSDLFTSVRSAPAEPETEAEPAAEDSLPEAAENGTAEAEQEPSAGPTVDEDERQPRKRRQPRRRRPQRGGQAEKEKPAAPERPAEAEKPAEPAIPAKPPRPASAIDEGADTEGLYTGAIPQGDVEVTAGSFESLGLSAPILKTVRDVGFEHPTPVQAGVIPRAMEGRDVIGLAETGSGKTAAFCLPLAERLTHGKGLRGLILCPTREIALQTKAFLDIFGRDHELETVSVIGGVKMGPQISGFRRRADILVATPGRLADHLRRRNLKLDELEELVLDEADHMLDLAFLPQIREILEQVPGTHRTMMFSATMPPPIERLAQLFMNDPVTVDFRPEGHVASGIEHRLYLVQEEDLKDCVIALLGEIEGSTLIFTRRKLHSEWLARQLELGGFDASRIHSDRSQAQRVRALRGFREGKHRILVATDVAARGLDIPRIQHVINYSLPETTDDYIHRAGRTARGSAAGIVSSIGTWKDKITVQDIERRLGIKIPRCTVEGVEPYVELKKRKQVRRRRLL